MSGHRIEANFLRIVKVQKAVKESPSAKTLFFKDGLCAHSMPGQFVMVWLPRIDEIPMSISSTHPDGLVSITVADVGEASRLLHKKMKNDRIGIRGPFGNNFKLVNGTVLLVGGGTGISPIAFLAEKLAELQVKMTLLLGAKTKEKLLFLSRIERMLPRSKAKMFVSAEDGSVGHEGVVTELAETLLTKERFDMIYACGKELMLREIFMLAEKHEIQLQASLERLMRCAIGLCGSCAIGKYRVCVDGPVFTGKQLREVSDEFGRFKQDFDGKKIPV